MNKFKFSLHHNQKSIHHDSFNKYFYLVKNTLALKSVYVLGIICWLISMYGYFLFLDLNILYWFIFGLLFLLLSFYYVLIYSINLFYKKPDLNTHKNIIKKFESLSAHQKPSVDIFLPVWGEKIKIINRTWSGIKSVAYPNLKVFVLDGGDVTLDLK